MEVLILQRFCICSNRRKAGGRENPYFISQRVKNSAMTGTKAEKYLEFA